MIQRWGKRAGACMLGMVMCGLLFVLSGWAQAERTDEPVTGDDDAGIVSAPGEEEWHRAEVGGGVLVWDGTGTQIFWFDSINRELLGYTGNGLGAALVALEEETESFYELLDSNPLLADEYTLASESTDKSAGDWQPATREMLLGHVSDPSRTVNLRTINPKTSTSQFITLPLANANCDDRIKMSHSSDPEVLEEELWRVVYGCGDSTSCDCNDGDRCTGDIMTSSNPCVCQHPAVDCNDGNCCTTDSCNSTTGCIHAHPTCELCCGDPSPCCGNSNSCCGKTGSPPEGAECGCFEASNDAPCGIPSACGCRDYTVKASRSVIYIEPCKPIEPVVITVSCTQYSNEPISYSGDCGPYYAMMADRTAQSLSGGCGDYDDPCENSCNICCYDSGSGTIAGGRTFGGAMTTASWAEEKNAQGEVIGEGALFAWIGYGTGGGVPKESCAIYGVVTASGLAIELAKEAKNGESLGKLKLEVQTGSVWSTHGRTAFKQDGRKTVEIEIRAKNSGGGGGGCCGGGSGGGGGGRRNADDDSFVDTVPATRITYSGSGGSREGQGERTIQTVQDSALEYVAYVGEHIASGPVLEYYHALDDVRLGIPGIGETATVALKGMNGNWQYQKDWWTDYRHFRAVLTDPNGFKYVYEATQPTFTRDKDWDGFFIPISEVHNPDNSLRAVYVSEQVPGTKKYKITKQVAPDGSSALIYAYEPDAEGRLYKLASVSVDADNDGTADGRSVLVTYDDLGRLAWWSHGCDTCGQTIEYVGDTQYVSKRWNAQGQLLAGYEYDDDMQMTRMYRGSDNPADPGYQLLREVIHNPTETLYKNYVDSTHYELTQVEGSVVSGRTDKSYTEYDGGGTELVTTFGFKTDGRPSETMLPNGKIIRKYFGTSGYDDGRVIEQARFDGSNEAMITQRHYTQIKGLTLPYSSTNPYGGTTQNNYDPTTARLSQTFEPSFGDFGTTSGKQGQTEYTYTASGQVELEKHKRPDGQFTITKNVYYPNGLLKDRIEDFGGAGLTTHYEYNGYNELSKVVDPRGVETHRFYDDQSRLRQSYTLEWNNGVVGSNAVEETQNFYDDLGRLILVRGAKDDQSFAPGSPADWSNTGYVYDVYGRRTQTIVNPVVTIDGEVVTSLTAGPNSEVTEYEYDYQDRLVRTTYPDGHWSKVEFDGRGLQTAEVTGSGETESLRTSYEYDLNGNLTQVTEPSGKVTIHHYDGFDRRYETIEGTKITHYVYAPAPSHSQPTRVWIEDTAAGTVLSDVTYQYDKLGRVWQQRQRVGAGADNNTSDSIALTTFDVLGRTEMQIAKALNNTTPNNVQQGDRVTAYTYDNLNRRLAVAILDNKPSVGGVQTFRRQEFVYDNSGNIAQQKVFKDAANYLLTTTSYDGRGLAVKVTDPENHWQESAYDSQGHLIKQMAKNNLGTALRQQRWIYDGLGQLETTVVFADANDEGSVDLTADQVTGYTYEHGRVRTIVTYNNGTDVPHVTVYDYDELGRQETVTDPLGNWQQSVYASAGDDVGLVTRQLVSDGIGVRTIQFVYDDRDRMIRRIEHGPVNVDAEGPDDLITQYQYDAAGRKVLITDAENKQTKYGYNLLGQQVQQIEAFGTSLARITDSVYDRLGRLTELKAYDGAQVQSTKYEYDLAGRRVKIAFPDGALTGTDNIRYVYNLAGWLTQRTDQRGAVTGYTYDNRGLLLTKTVGWALPTIDTFTYDGIGRMRSAKRQAGSPLVEVSESHFDYNDLSQLTSESQELLNSGTPKLLNYSCDQAGNRKMLGYPADVGVNLTYTVDPLGRVDQINRNGTLLVDYDYVGQFLDKRTITTTAGNQIVYDVGYDDYRRVNSIENKLTSPSAMLMSYAMPRDKVGNVDLITATGPNQPSVDYSYDDLYRLTSATYGNGMESFAMDNLGNRNSYGDTRPGGTTIPYGANNPVNEYSTISGQTLTYDLAGNLTHDESGFDYTYDADNRLIRVVKGATTVTFDYDALGRRIRKSDGTNDTLYYYDGLNILAAYASTGALQRYFINGSQYIDEHVLMHDSVDSYYLLGNLYSVTGLTSADGAITESYTYDSYGKVAGLGSSGNPYYFTGQPLDLIVGKQLYHYRARFYDPLNGRFFQRDQLGISERIDFEYFYNGTPVWLRNRSASSVYASGFDLYEYVSSMPTGLVDPTGYMPPGSEPPGMWYACCDGVKYNMRTQTCCNKVVYDRQKDHVCCKDCDGETKYLALQSIWICKRILNHPWTRWIVIGSISHTYICCNGYNSNCYGMQSNQYKPGDKPGYPSGPPTKKGDPISPEAFPFGNCTEVKVCPSVKCAKCNNPTANDDYSLAGPGENCHEWAWCGVPGY